MPREVREGREVLVDYCSPNAESFIGAGVKLCYEHVGVGDWRWWVELDGLQPSAFPLGITGGNSDSLTAARKDSRKTLTHWLQSLITALKRT